VAERCEGDRSGRADKRVGAAGSRDLHPERGEGQQLGRVLGTSLAIVGGIVTILTLWWRQRAAAAPVTPEALEQAAEVLASRVAEQRQREAEARSLDDPDRCRCAGRCPLMR